jgi:hypothetical protein
MAVTLHVNGHAQPPRVALCGALVRIASLGTVVSVRPFYGRCLLAYVLVGACGGCSAIVDTSNLVVRCEIPDGGVDPCAAVGLFCADGTCQSCKAVPELCDGHDNDCDGKIDEGFDPDGDGFTWCGGGHPELVDCAPNDPTIHPPGVNPDGSAAAPPPELCDGKDNDCDGSIDEDNPSCGALKGCDQTGCPPGEPKLSCDLTTKQCVAPRVGGSSCKTDAECGGGICVVPAALGLSNVRSNLCGSACCRDRDCPDGSVCVQSGTGARVCLPLEIAGRQLAAPGKNCGQSSECASGVCQRGQCVATCSRDADCGREICRLNVQTSSLLSGAGAWICGTSGGRGAAGDPCTSFDPTSCQSALCFSVQCAAPCGSDADCGEGLACRYVSVQGLLGGGRVTACITPPDTMQAAPPGPTCCTSADCQQGQACRPMQTQNNNREWGMYCGSSSVQ